ncbi:3'-5' exonuclease [Cutibacterium sp.]|uniref:3'-5' exonuclease n=1 Tax=Cutibacterium sp. TaxID=1912221 RepID=UPI0026DC2783|nr:3'-5' exonuclease [Cutibacterium sp.]MDO4413226.1 3'-5' exonuclease [Cutibacterium sp.]
MSSGRSAWDAQTSRHHPPLIPTPRQIADPQFVAVDFETANRMGGVSACQLAMVKVRDGQVVDRFNTLIRPPRGWDSFEFTYLHGISATDVWNSPMWPSIADDISHFVNGATVYAHNAAFDSRVWRQLDEYFGTVTLPSPFFCSYRTAQRLIPGLPNYKLPTVLEACEPSFQLDHHRADSDAEACALIVCQLQRLARQL